MITLIILSTIICVSFAILVVLLDHFRQPNTKGLPLPPGPRRWPIVGNWFQLPRHHIWKTYAEWGKAYGEITYTSAFGKRTIILNSARAAVELLEQRRIIYSGRPTSVMVGEMVGYDHVLTFMQYGAEYLRQRKLLHSLLGTSDAIKRLGLLLERETLIFLRRILNKPEDVLELSRSAADTIILKIAYGLDPEGDDDPILQLIRDGVDDYLELMADHHLVDTFPFLKYVPAFLPGAGFKRQAQCSHELAYSAIDIPFDVVKKQRMAGTASPSFTAALFRQEKVTHQKEYAFKWAAGALFSAGSDTTTSAVNSFFLAMTLFPSIQRRAQEELDEMIGDVRRLPTLSDRENLPYIDALVKEVLRWNPVAPIGFPHKLTADDEYRGYFMPKDSTVIANIWNILHDPDLYKNPMEFNPARFLPDPSAELPKGKSGKPEHDPRAFCFGFGRRTCPGLHLADSMLFLFCASTLAVFSIRKETYANEEGIAVEIEPIIDYSSGITSHPRFFECHIQPRSQELETLLHAYDTPEDTDTRPDSSPLP